MMALMVAAVSMAGMAQDKQQKAVGNAQGKVVMLRKADFRKQQQNFVKLDKRDFRRFDKSQARFLGKMDARCRCKKAFSDDFQKK